MTRPYVRGCYGRSPHSGKPVGQRHSWPMGWGKGYCEYCGRTLEDVLEKPAARKMLSQRRLKVGMSKHDPIDVTDEEMFKAQLVSVLGQRIKTFPSQRQAAKAWAMAQSTVNVIAKGHVGDLTLKQLCNVVWKSGGMIQLGVSYSS